VEYALCGVNLKVFALLKKLGVTDYVTHLTCIVCPGVMSIDLVDALNVSNALKSHKTMTKIELVPETKHLVLSTLAFQIGLCAATCKANDYIIIFTENPDYVNVFQLPNPTISHVFALSSV
jgi:hypothetical protein